MPRPGGTNARGSRGGSDPRGVTPVGDAEAGRDECTGQSRRERSPRGCSADWLVGWRRAVVAGMSGQVGPMETTRDARRPGGARLRSLVLEYSCRHRLEPLTRVCLRGWDASLTESGPLSLRIACAALWSTVTRRCTEHYGRVVDFVNIVWQQASYLISYRHYLKLCIAFKAKMVMEMFVKQRSLLDILQTLDKFFPELLPADPRASTSDIQKERQCRLQFRKLVLLLIRDRDFQEWFLRDELEDAYGTSFMVAAQNLLREFLERLENALLPPRLDQLLASCVDRGSLSPREQSLVCLLTDPGASIPDVLLQQPWIWEKSDGGQDSGDLASGASGSSTGEECGLRCGHHPGTEPVTANTQEGEDSVSSREQASEEEQTVSEASTKPSPTGHLFSRGLMERDGGGENCGRRLQPIVFSALHFDQLSDEEVGVFPSLTQSPPDPLQSQQRECPATACPLPQDSGAEAGTTERTHQCPRSPNQGLEIELLATAPLSPEVQGRLLQCSQFQPRVLLFRLSSGQKGQPAAAGSHWRQRERPVVSGNHHQLGEVAPTPPWHWNLRKRPRQCQADSASWTVSKRMAMAQGSPDERLLSSSEESSLSDTSDDEYFPFCSQLTPSGHWVTYPARNEMGQFIAYKPNGII
ncbi:uncharacterized protein LOC132407085 isoform X2 [Hypanus sabinus]|uniref:uncharacterized protein LOC132407085 isoform X2 n=1 Tax=Hypanus sabinus TaxID=79690 RepID=UPI0028C3F332|nr:uncharacterized protein LOC132407085 isoform X2 [Hypanus sabinus]